MSHFYSEIQGSKGKSTRCGTKSSGMETWCAAWGGAVCCNAYVDDLSGVDMVTVRLAHWQGKGDELLLYDGPIAGGQGEISKAYLVPVIQKLIGQLLDDPSALRVVEHLRRELLLQEV